MTNIVILTGRLGQDPREHTFSNGNRVAEIRLATNKYQKTGSDGTNAADWHTVRIFGPGEKGVVDRVMKIARKGSLVQVRGRLTYSESVNNDGVKKSYTTIDCYGQDAFEFLAKAAGTTKEEGNADIPMDSLDDDALGLLSDDELS